VKVLAIARNTYRETARQPIYYILLALSTALIGLSFFFTLFAFGEEAKMIKDMSLATITLCGLLMALFASANVITEEIDKKTVLTVLCKPVSRVEFVLGKFLGIAFAVLIATVLLSLVLMTGLGLYDRFTREPYAQEAPKGFDYVVLAGAFLSCLQIFVLTAVAVAVSTRMPMVVNVVFCFSIYILGHLTNYLHQTFGNPSGTQTPLLRWVVTVLYAVMPNLENFNVASAIALGSAVSISYVVITVAYALAYTGIALLVAMILFQEREVM
jgi:ABC-type transport system involved in multi-copper enzyme maturation permease subunit